MACGVASRASVRAAERLRPLCWASRVRAAYDMVAGLSVRGVCSRSECGGAFGLANFAPRVSLASSAMPIFDYTCADCGKTSELLVRGSQDKPACPHCGSVKLEKQLPVVAVKGLKSDHVHTNSCGCGQPRGGCGN